MAFAGITDPAKRADLIAYLEQTTRAIAVEAATAQL
jgi:cytochrome c2